MVEGEVYDKNPPIDGPSHTLTTFLSLISTTAYTVYTHPLQHTPPSTHTHLQYSTLSTVLSLHTPIPHSPTSLSLSLSHLSHPSKQSTPTNIPANSISSSLITIGICTSASLWPQTLISNPCPFVSRNACICLSHLRSFSVLRTLFCHVFTIHNT